MKSSDVEAMLWFLAPIYFLPSLAAIGKRHALAIIALNVLLGWSVIGWIAALVWALAAQRPPPLIESAFMRSGRHDDFTAEIGLSVTDEAAMRATDAAATVVPYPTNYLPLDAGSAIAVGLAAFVGLIVVLALAKA